MSKNDFSDNTFYFGILKRNHGIHVCMVDTKDAPLIYKHKWYVDYGTHGSLRVRTNIKGKKVSLHRLILKTKLEVDHINGNQLDNRRENLRRATRHQNACNRKIFKNNKTGHKGIIKKGNRFVVRISAKRKSKYLGSFDSLNDAIKARKEAELKYHKNFARI